jgi:hypothetical protein
MTLSYSVVTNGNKSGTVRLKLVSFVININVDAMMRNTSIFVDTFDIVIIKFNN